MDPVPIAAYLITLEDDPFLRISLSIFCSGCLKRCNGCQQPLLWDPNNGVMTDIEDIKKVIKDRSELVKSVVFLGGEFTLYPEQLIELAKFSKSLNLNTILYTGYLYEELRDDIKSLMDIIIDGEYDEKLFTGSFPASSNQRVYLNGNKIDPSTLPINTRYKIIKTG